MKDCAINKNLTRKGGGESGGRVIQLLERFFFWWGCRVASRPWIFILAALVATALGSLGLLNFSSEADGWSYWLPEGSRHKTVQKWKKENFVEDTRGTITLLSHEENVLTREALLLLLDLHNRVEAVEYEGKGYDHACMKVPVTNIGLAERRRRKRQVEVAVQSSPNQSTIEEAMSLYLEDATTQSIVFPSEDYVNFYDSDENGGAAEEKSEDQLEDLPKDIYCDIVETLEERCGEYSVLEIWKYDPDVISGLTRQDIVDAINTVDESPIFGLKTDYANYLGQVERNLTGHVVGAKSLRTIWYAIQWDKIE